MSEAPVTQARRVDVRWVAEELAAFYQCGLSTEEIIAWLTVSDSSGRRVFDRTIKAESKNTTRSIARQFCTDCHPPYRSAMERAGRCLRGELGEVLITPEEQP